VEELAMAVRQRPVVLASALMLALTALSCTSKQAETPVATTAAAMNPLQRGEYLSNIMGCNDCHTPGAFYGAPSFERKLSGSEIGWQGPWGVSYASNLTPDPETGLGTWTVVEIERALRSGVRKDGSPILPPMPWPNIANLTADDMSCLIAYLKSIPPVKHKVPERVPPNTVATGAVIPIPAPGAWDAPKTAPTP
jgi:mono/diheme cytochrome c family protein